VRNSVEKPTQNRRGAIMKNKMTSPKWKKLGKRGGRLYEK